MKDKPVMEHPGLELGRKIKASGFRQNAIAEQIGVQPTWFNEFLKGKRLLPAYGCVNMQKAMGYGRELWRKQADYEWHLASLANASPAPLVAGGAGEEGEGEGV